MRLKNAELNSKKNCQTRRHPLRWCQNHLQTQQQQQQQQHHNPEQGTIAHFHENQSPPNTSSPLLERIPCYPEASLFTFPRVLYLTLTNGERELGVDSGADSSCGEGLSSQPSCVQSCRASVEMAQGGEDESSARGLGEGEEARWRERELTLTEQHESEVASLVASHASAIMNMQTTASEKVELRRLQVEKLETSMAAKAKVAQQERDGTHDACFHA
mmetsp:Transcript_25774/g.51765  ORF Transcript_25774/g.51765 Transcript_25774/m.51765 type:complete len:217 (-) Transcript_25774:86-736(-)